MATFLLKLSNVFFFISQTSKFVFKKIFQFLKFQNYYQKKCLIVEYQQFKSHHNQNIFAFFPHILILLRFIQIFLYKIRPSTSKLLKGTVCSILCSPASDAKGPVPNAVQKMHFLKNLKMNFSSD